MVGYDLSSDALPLTVTIVAVATYENYILNLNKNEY